MQEQKRIFLKLNETELYVDFDLKEFKEEKPNQLPSVAVKYFQQQCSTVSHLFKSSVWTGATVYNT